MNNCIVRNIIESYEIMDKPAPASLPLMSDEDIIKLFEEDVWMSKDFISSLFKVKQSNMNETSFTFDSGCPMLGGEDMGLERV